MPQDATHAQSLDLDEGLHKGSARLDFPHQLRSFASQLKIKMTTTNGNGVSANDIPFGTAKSLSESQILKKLQAAMNWDHLTTLGEVLLQGASGEPIDDKTYLMERIIALTADLPLHDKMSDTLTNSFLSQLWDDLDHPPTSYLGHDYVFRKPDGSNNNIQWPHIGKAGQPYARSVRPERVRPPPPDPDVVFESLLKRKEFVPHPNKISSVLFYVASLIIHDCFHTSHTDYAISETSSYLDLSPLYGSNEAQQKAMRTFKDGKIHPDCFADSRMLGFPPGVGVLCIMFNRFHNMVVENLAKIDEGGRFSQLKNPDINVRRRTGLTAKIDVKDEPKTDAEKAQAAEKDYDEALFQTGRLVTCGLYVNIILGDYVRTILGLNHCDSLWNLDPRAGPGNALKGGKKIAQASGNSVSAEFSLVYRWHSCVSPRDEKWTDDFMAKLFQETMPGRAPKDASMGEIMYAALKWSDDLKNTPPPKRNFEGLKRQENGSFADEDLARLWQDSVDDVAGAFGARHVPVNLKFVEILSMRQARAWNLASLNEFRAYFKLEPHKTFKDINPDPEVARSLEKLYGHPDNVEIYPGIVVESAKKPMAPGSGLCASWTTSRAILSDAVALVRGDRFYTVDYTPNNLTNWGFQQSSNDLDINWGGVFYKLVLNAFPNNFAKNSIYAHFPLTSPAQSKALLSSMHRADQYSYEQMIKAAPVLQAKASSDMGKQALSQNPTFTKQWPSSSAVLNVPKEAKEKPAHKMTFAEAILSDPKFESTVQKFYQTSYQKLWKAEQYELGGYQVIDVVADVSNTAHLEFLTKELGIPAEGEEFKKLLVTFGHVFEHAYSINHGPNGLGKNTQGLVHRVASGIYNLFAGAPEEHLGSTAIAKMQKTNGAAATQAVWQDILPTVALLLTTLSRSSATVVETALPLKTAEIRAPDVTIAVQATSAHEDLNKGQLVAVHISADADIQDDHAADIRLAQAITKISNDTLRNVLGQAKNLERMPGPRGIIKKVQLAAGDVKYLNETESQYVPLPQHMQLRWKA